MFTKKEVKAAKEVRDDVIKSGVDELKSIYMAGEIVMWDEMRLKQPQAFPEAKPKWKCSNCGATDTAGY